MKEKRSKKHKKSSKEKRSSESKKNKQKRHSSDSSSNSESDEWVEQERVKSESAGRDEWMAMTGMLKTYTKDDIKPKQDKTEKMHIDSYNPATSSRELNPYWKDGGSGVPQSSESLSKSRKFMKPSYNDDYYNTSSSSSKNTSGRQYKQNRDYERSSNWRKETMDKREEERKNYNLRDDKKDNLNLESDHKDKKLQKDNDIHDKLKTSIETKKPDSSTRERKDLYLSDEKMNKLAAKIVKAEIMGDLKQVEELKSKLEAARQYRKNNPNVENLEDDRVLLMSTTSTGNSRPLTNNPVDTKGKGNKRKAQTHDSEGRLKYFGDDDKYNLKQMFEQEKYGNNYNEDAELVRAANKSKNPNDDLADIFLDNITKNKNPTRNSEIEKQQAINQNVKLERSLEGCEYCFDSKNMLKHLIVSCGNKIYMALPSRTSLVKGHCILSTIQHSTCVTNVDEDVWDEILYYRKMITQYYNSQDQDVVFYETATRLHRFPHLVINCVPMPRDVGDTASIYFKKALLECEAEWSMNKKVVELKGKNIRRGVPKGLPYFWVDFGMDPGFAHVIEDQQLFPKSFAEEIIGGMLDLDHTLWKNPKKEYGDIQRKKVIEFVNKWKPFEQNFKDNS
ncbi:CWF19-like protein 2 homolog [Danaus plexippus]|uniref:CWF19-like protein 2 homolog n=1 Tax=Danaus plexippus TaxID=13037 RepID=UPI002AB154BA|nr:CWF19-like protein 2 homolog [Danaus plexippus]